MINLMVYFNGRRANPGSQFHNILQPFHGQGKTIREAINEAIKNANSDGVIYCSIKIIENIKEDGIIHRVKRGWGLFDIPRWSKECM